MKQTFFALLVALCCIFSCTPDKHAATDDISAINLQEIASANGIYMADSPDDLKSIIAPSVEHLVGRDMGFLISSYEFLETNTTTAMMIDILTDSKEKYRLMYVREYGYAPAEYKCYTITYGRDCACQANGFIANGEVNFAYAGDCNCATTIREHDCKVDTN